MSKWECSECCKDKCVLKLTSCHDDFNTEPKSCPISGTDCDWYKVEDKDNEETKTT
jgi:hypothetical protein